jgi:CheY-like chemotaxis protein
VTDTADGDTAVRLAVEWAPDVVLLDIGLPAMDGYEVARRVRRRVGRLVRLVALTGYGDPATRRRVAEAGFDGHLVKPATLEQIEGLLA